MRLSVALVGPTHPYKGGIAQHTTILAHNLTSVGYDVEIVSWRRQYPRLLYPGDLYVPEGRPEITPYPRTSYVLAWNNPATWVREAQRLRRRDVVVFVIVNPIQAIAYTVMARLLRRNGARTVALFHNVVPHESRRVDEQILRAILTTVNAAITHTELEASHARRLGATEVHVAALPPSLPAGPYDPPSVSSERRNSASATFLAFGIVREYKGIDILIRAAAKVPQARIMVVGEFWGGHESYARLADRMGVSDRVSIVDKYIPVNEVPSYFEAADVAVFPYRSATSSGAVLLALDMGLPVVVTEVGALPAASGDGRYGIVCKPNDVDALAHALTQFCNPLIRNGFTKSTRSRDREGSRLWSTYLAMMVDVLGSPNSSDDS